jgi:voltage-gated potassium channel
VAGARWLRLLGMTILLVMFYFLVPISADPTGGLVLRSTAALVVFTALGAVVVGQVRLVMADTEHHLDGLLLAIALVWVTFSLTYYVMSLQQPDQVDGLDTRLDALYFTASTILTIGFGDVHAVGQAARALVLVQMGFDVVFVTAAAQVISNRLRGRTTARAGLTAERTKAQRWNRPRGPR